MGRGPQLTESEKKKIKEFNKKKMSLRVIAKKIGRSHNVVSNFLKDPLLYGTKKTNGRKKKISPRLKRHILNKVSNKRISASKIIDELSLQMCRMTVYRTIKSAPHIVLKKKKKSPVLTRQHKIKRLEFARKHMTWKCEWQNVVWTDEKKCNLDGPDGFSYYWHDLRKEPLIFSKRNQQGGGVMFWAPFGWNYKGEIEFLDGRIDAAKYVDMLKNKIEDLNNHFGHEKWIFQQDNAPCHKAKLTMNWFKKKKVEVLGWPPCSPDLNPIENVWGLLVRKVYSGGRQFYSIQDLKKEILNAWNDIKIEELNKLVSSLPDRLYDVIRLNGSKTKY